MLFYGAARYNSSAAYTMLQSHLMPKSTHQLSHPSFQNNLRIIYWNIRAGGGRRIDGIYKQLLAWQPDIIGLSEFRGTPASQQLAAQLFEAGYPHQITSFLPSKLVTNALLLASRYPFCALNQNICRFWPNAGFWPRLKHPCRLQLG